MEIIEFIDLIKGENPDKYWPEESKEYMTHEEFIDSTSRNIITEIFTNGSCGRFAKILSFTFPGGSIQKTIDGSHIVYEYNKRLYDITGDVTHLYREIESIDKDNLEDYDRYSFFNRGPSY